MNRERIRCWVLFLLLFGCVGLLSPELQAQAILAPSGRTLFNRATLVRSFVEYDRFSLRTDGSSIDMDRYITPLAVVYGFYPKWSVIVAQPYVTAHVTGRMGNETRRQALNGLADVQLFVEYDGLYSSNVPGGFTRLTGVFGLQAPTGARRFSTGAFEYTGGLVFEKQVSLKYVFTGDFEYTFATENRRGVSMGDHIRFDAVPGYYLVSRDSTSPDAPWLRKFYDRAFHNGAYFLLEFNGTWQAHARKLGNKIPDTGGTTLLISPGIQYFPGRRVMLEFSAPISTVQALNGTQPKPKTAFLFGFRYLF